jgi:hypothetical protein
MAREVKAKYDYNSGHEDDLSFTAGQIITVTEEVDEEWYNGQYFDSQRKLHQGMFPRNFVTVLPKPIPAPPPPANKQNLNSAVPAQQRNRHPVVHETQPPKPPPRRRFQPRASRMKVALL